MDQFNQAPAPSQDEFDDAVDSLNGSLAAKTSYNSTIFSSVSITNDFVNDRVMQIACEIRSDKRTGQLAGYQSINLKVTKTNIVLEALKTTGSWETVWTK